MLIDFDLLTLSLFVVIYICLAICLIKKWKKKREYMFFFSILYIYMVGVINYTMFPILITPAGQIEEKWDLLANLNLIPLGRLGAGDVKTSVQNIVLALPFGFLLPLWKPIKRRTVFVCAILFGTVIEILQLFENVLSSFPNRTVDVNDIVFNFFGVCIGYLLYRILICVLLRFWKKVGLDYSGIFRYILGNHEEQL